jgi:hypothetical protein
MAAPPRTSPRQRTREETMNFGLAEIMLVGIFVVELVNTIHHW